MPERNKLVDLPFYEYLWQFYAKNRGKIRKHYRKITKRFLDYNDPENPHAYLWRPQYEALEMYVFLKEYLNNDSMTDIFTQWFKRGEKFEGRDKAYMPDKDQIDVFKAVDGEMYEAVYEMLEEFKQSYSNYIYALTMGLGKTTLMATSIFYEFILANKFPEDEKYCHNALVFAPDKTVLQSLKEIIELDKTLVVPPEYVNWLNSNIRFYFLEDTGVSLNTIDRTDFNIIISNTQKIIIKEQHKEIDPQKVLFSGIDAMAINEEYRDLYILGDEKMLKTNQRFEKLTRLKQLGIYVDEAHHVFGNKLELDIGVRITKTSLRRTINILADKLNNYGTHVVGCYNYTGTPYCKNRLLPEVVYSYGLKDAIDNEYLKQVKINGYLNIRSKEFVDQSIRDFWDKNEDKRYEGMLPKIAFYAATIDELEQELYPNVEATLIDLGIDTSKILINVGDPKLTTNDDIREFNNLDSAQSEKQFILLVGKGKEGWDCRSLFGVALFRKPKSRIFVLQATMRCMRRITDVQQTGRVYLSNENMDILRNELQENFRLKIEDINFTQDNKKTYKVQLTTEEPITIKIKKLKKLYKAEEKEPGPGIDLELDEIDEDRYKIIHEERDIKNIEKKAKVKEDISYIKNQREYTKMTLVAEIAKYLNKSPVLIDHVICDSKQGVEKILKVVNKFNETLYDWIIPHLFQEFYDLKEYESTEEQEVALAKKPDKGYYEVRSLPELMSFMDDNKYSEYNSKSFHLDRYCFDSRPELTLFDKILFGKNIKKIYFTGMLTHGQSEFFINYIDPESHTVRSYYPDFLIIEDDDSCVILEVKGDNRIDEPVVRAKQEYAQQMAQANDFRYVIVPSTKVERYVHYLRD